MYSSIKHYLIFDNVYKTIANINDVLYIEDNHISLAGKNKNLFFKGFIDEDFYKRFHAGAHFKNSHCGFIFDSNKAFNCFATRRINNRLGFALVFSNSKFVPKENEHKQFFTPNTIVSATSRYTHPGNLFSTLFQLGIKHDKSPVATLCLSRHSLNIALRTIISDRSNLLYTLFLIRGFLASIRFDLSSSQIEGLEIGYLHKKKRKHNKPNGNSQKGNEQTKQQIPTFEKIDLSSFVLYNLNKKFFEFGSFAKYNNKKFALSGKYSINNNEVAIEASGIIIDSCLLQGNINSQKIFELQTKISPKPWIDITFKSKSVINSSTLPTFGWSLDFHGQ